MTFEELIILDVPQLPEGHPAHFMEFEIKGKLLKKKQDHDKEHEDMLIAWDIPYDTESLDYTILNARDGHADRMWHIALHLRYWKERNMNEETVKQFESLFPEIDLLTIPLPIVG